MSAPLRVGMAGLGTVGLGTLTLVRAQAELIAMRAGRPIEVTAVAARDRGRDRGVDLSGLAWFDDPVALAQAGDIDLFVELMGGAGDPARASVTAALDTGRPVVTANKALIAEQGIALAMLAEARDTHLAFEAAVAGGIPILKALREGLTANAIGEIHGILNGTCNYILTTMRETGRAFGDVLKEAQALGYAEADPFMDISGTDAAQKLAILATLGFGCRVASEEVLVEGIEHVDPTDIAFAEELGMRIKLLGIARLGPEGLECRVQPCLLPRSAPLGQVEDVFNAVVAEGDFVDRLVMIGRGAGAGPTASAVVADIVDIASGRTAPPFGRKVAELGQARPVAPEARTGAFYLRLMVRDQPGVIAEIAAVLKAHDVSLESLLQRARDPGQAVPVVMTTHETTEAAMGAVRADLDHLASIVEPPRILRIESF